MDVYSADYVSYKPHNQLSSVRGSDIIHPIGFLGSDPHKEEIQVVPEHSSEVPLDVNTMLAHLHMDTS